MRNAVEVFTVALLTGVLLTSVAGGQSQPTTETMAVRKSLAKNALQRLREQDSFSAIEFLGRHPDPLIATRAFGDLAGHLYWKEKDLAGAVAMGRAGVQHGLATGASLEKEDPDKTYELNSAAKAICYDLASFTWDGWGEAGIVIGKGELKIGLDAAKTNLRLAKELKKGRVPLGRAHWMLGGHHLSRKDYTNAHGHFTNAIKYLAGESPEEALLSTGFVAIATMLGRPDDKSASANLEHVRKELAEYKNGKFFTDQLDAALKVFSRTGSE